MAFKTSLTVVTLDAIIVLPASSMSTLVLVGVGLF